MSHQLATKPKYADYFLDGKPFWNKMQEEIRCKFISCTVLFWPGSGSSLTSHNQVPNKFQGLCLSVAWLAFYKKTLPFLCCNSTPRILLMCGCCNVGSWLMAFHTVESNVLSTTFVNNTFTEQEFLETILMHQLKKNLCTLSLLWIWNVFEDKPPSIVPESVNSGLEKV